MNSNYKMNRFIDDHPELQGALMETEDGEVHIIHDYELGTIEVPVGAGPTKFLIGYEMQKDLAGREIRAPVYRIFDA
jgi:hypothetical protein